MSVDEWDQRAVCPDGTCIGVIGPDGWDTPSTAEDPQEES